MDSQAKKWSTAQTRSDTVQSAYWGVEFIPRIYLLYCPIGKQYHIYSRLDIPIYIYIYTVYTQRGGKFQKGGRVGVYVASKNISRK